MNGRTGHYKRHAAVDSKAATSSMRSAVVQRGRACAVRLQETATLRGRVGSWFGAHRMVFGVSHEQHVALRVVGYALRPVEGSAVKCAIPQQRPVAAHLVNECALHHVNWAG
jgi:hypothetical protein